MSVFPKEPSGTTVDVDPHALLRELALARQRVLALESELETRDRLLTSVSHELKSPLNTILGWVRLLRDGTLPEEKRERALATVERSAEVQTQLIEDFVDLSRLVSGTLVLEKAHVAVAAVIDGAVERARQAAATKGVAIVVEPVAAMDPVFGDLARLQQMVWNLLSNAVKFTDGGGAVRVAALRRDASVEITVTDSGRGLAPEMLSKLFDRLHRAESAPGTHRERIALGLPIVRRLAELHGGQVRAESAGVGCGSTFAVTLPLCSRQLS